MVYKLFWFLNSFFLRLAFKRIGLFSYIGKTVFIYGGKGVLIGNKVRIFPGLRIETHNNGKIVIEDDISIQQNFHITSSHETLIIGSHTTILGNVFITNIDHDYKQIGKHILKQPYIVKKTGIGENCFIGYGAAIQAGTILGKQCIVGANSVVRGNYPDYCVIVGAPARVVKRYNADSGIWEKTDKHGNFIII
jgi:acetyltransferase-like isoleucine patch superfamily enzyme